MTTVSVGLDETEFDSAARLYFDALRQKLAPFLGPPESAVPILAASLRGENVIVAREGDTILGLAGYQCDRKGFIDLSLSALFRRYPLSGAVRLGGLCLLDRPCPPDGIVLDGICVAPDARGRGIGTALLEAIEQLAIERGKQRTLLAVIDTNPRARSLYERVGYTPIKTESVGPLKGIFGFNSATTMEKTLLSESHAENA